MYIPTTGLGYLVVSEQSFPLEISTSPYYYNIIPIDEIPIWSAPGVLRDSVTISVPGVYVSVIQVYLTVPRSEDLTCFEWGRLDGCQFFWPVSPISPQPFFPLMPFIYSLTVLGTDGWLSTTLSGYDPRPVQWDFYRSGKHIFMFILLII